MESLIEGLRLLAAQYEWLRVDLLGELLLATLLGGLIGWEREWSGKPAGLRTNILICVGAALLTDLSIQFPSLTVTELVRADPARIAAQIVSGIGFLGAGTIIQSRGSVTGLTTAATLWVVAAIGMAVGSGFYVEASGSTILVIIALVPLDRLEAWLNDRRATRSLRIVLEARAGALERMENLLEEAGLRIRVEEVKKEPAGECIVVFFQARGAAEAFMGVRRALVEDDLVRELSIGGYD